MRAPVSGGGSASNVMIARPSTDSLAWRAATVSSNAGPSSLGAGGDARAQRLRQRDTEARGDAIGRLRDEQGHRHATTRAAGKASRTCASSRSRKATSNTGCVQTQVAPARSFASRVAAGAVAGVVLVERGGNERAGQGRERHRHRFPDRQVRAGRVIAADAEHIVDAAAGSAGRGRRQAPHGCGPP